MDGIPFSLSTHQLMAVCIISIFFPSVKNPAIYFWVRVFLWTYIFIFLCVCRHLKEELLGHQNIRLKFQ